MASGDPKETDQTADITLKHKAGKLWHVRERRRLASLGLAGLACCGKFRQVAVSHGMAGKVRLGSFRHGLAWQAWYETVCLGMAGFGMVRQARLVPVR